MSSQRQIILDIIPWFVSDSNLEVDVEINGEVFLGETLVERLSQIPINWILDPEHPRRIIFLYPVTGVVHDVFNSEPVETVAYDPANLPTAIEVLGAIGTHYAQKVFPDHLLDEEEIDHNGKVLSIDYPKYVLLQHNEMFAGLELIRPGIYSVLLKFN